MDMAKLKLLSEEEASKLYDRVLSEDDKRSVLFFCSDDLKLKEISLFNSFSKEIFSFIMCFKDDTKANEAFYKYLSSEGMDIYSFVSILEYCDVSYREKFVNLFCYYLEQNSNFKYNLFNLAKLLELFEDGYREKLFNRLLNILESRVVDKKISSSSMDNVIMKFPKEKRLDIFIIFVDLYKRGKLEDFRFSLADIFKTVDEDNRFDFLIICLENKLISGSYYISQLFEVFSDVNKDKVLDLFYQYEVKNGTKYINNKVIACCLCKYSADIRLEKYKSFAMGNPRYKAFDVINSLTDVNFKFEVLNLEIGAYNLDSEEEKGKLFRILEMILAEQFEWYGGKFPDGKVIYNELIDFYVDFFGLNKKNFIKFIEKFSYVSLRYLGNLNVRSIINFSGDKFDAFMSIFKEDNLKLDDDSFNTAINSILQREFMVLCKDDYNIFSKFEELINKSLLKEVETLILEISDVIDINKFLSKYNIDSNSFLQGLLDGKHEMLDILHDITDSYILKKREMYVKERMINIKDELGLNKRYEKNFILKKWVATSSVFKIIIEIRDILDEKLSQEQLFLKNSRDILKDIIEFKKNPKKCVLDDEYKKYLRVFDSLLEILYFDDKLKDPTNDPNARYVYSFKDIDLYNFLDLISELNINKIDEFLLNNESLLSRLNEILFKYRLLGWGNTFSSLTESADFEFSNNTLMGLLDYFYRIDSELINSADENFSLTKLVSLSNCYGSSSSKYGLLFGDDVFRLIAVNGGKNKASMVRYKRLELGTHHVVGMYNREVVPVPPMDCDVQIDNQKSLNVVVGNATNMNNLVLGELTNACMRIGGVFYDFYKECLEGQVGFHIILSDSVTGEFVSRVSGIRNGNTLFLNELRNSESNSYTDEDVVSAIRLVSSILIEKSKISEFPIDNVVITSDLAMNPYAKDMVDLNLLDRDEALYGLSHNLNNKSEAIVLASSRDDGKLVDINLGKDKISYYKPGRDKVREYVGEDAIRRVIQLEIMVNSLLNGISFENIDVEVSFDVLRCISGEDWYISVDKYGNIKEFILDNSKGKERTLEEMSNYRDKFLQDNLENERGVVRK